jgi:hypothetical protein
VILVGSLLLLAFLIAAVCIVTYFKLSSAFRRERFDVPSKSMLG